MAQWSTLMPCNREAAGSNLSGVLAFIQKALIMKLTIVEKNLLSWTAMHIDFVMCKKQTSTTYILHKRMIQPGHKMRLSSSSNSRQDI